MVWFEEYALCQASIFMFAVKKKHPPSFSLHPFQTLI